MRFHLLRLTAALFVIGSLVLVATQPVRGQQADTQGPRCGAWRQQPPPSVPPMGGIEDRRINDGELDVTVVGEVLPGRPTSIAFGPDGALYVAVSYNQEYPLQFYSALYGSIFQLIDGEARLLVDGLHHPNGLLFLGDDLYVSQLGEILRIEDVAGAACRSVSSVVTNLPFDEVHQTNGMAERDGRIYVSQGYVYNPLPSSRVDLIGTVFSFLPNGDDLRVEASGIRNTYDIAFDAEGRLWGGDNGPNQDSGMTSADQIYPDELNQITPGNDYGFHLTEDEPLVGAPDATPTVCFATTCGTQPVTHFDKHTAPTGIVWDDQRARLLVALSSWGQVQTYDPVTGALEVLLWDATVPTGIALGPDGAPYVAEWGANRVVRVAFPPAEGGV